MNYRLKVNFNDLRDEDHTTHTSEACTLRTAYTHNHLISMMRSTKRTLLFSFFFLYSVRVVAFETALCGNVATARQRQRLSGWCRTWTKWIFSEHFGKVAFWHCGMRAHMPYIHIFWNDTLPCMRFDLNVHKQRSLLPAACYSPVVDVDFFFFFFHLLFRVFFFHSSIFIGICEVVRLHPCDTHNFWEWSNGHSFERVTVIELIFIY